jgi:hypothetical protein
MAVLAVGMPGREIWLLDMETLQVRTCVDGLALSPNGRTVATVATVDYTNSSSWKLQALLEVKVTHF